MISIIPMNLRTPELSLTPLIGSLEIENGVMVEIGSYQGESAEQFAKSGKFEKIYCVDPWINIDNTEDMIYNYCSFDLVEKEFDKRMKPYNFVYKRKAFSKDVVCTFNNESLDFVYIDGDHRYESVKHDISVWISKVKEGGYIAGHDYGTKDGVKIAVDEMFRGPIYVFPDYSWVVRI